jgi:8-oxo-dGTP pyrophosphatase MutT (NUDIX family)
VSLAPARADRSVFWPLAGSLRIIVDPAPEAQMTAEQQQRWDLLCARNPALFDGPIYTVTRLELGGGIALPGDATGGRAPEHEAAGAPIGRKPDATAGELRCRRSRYHEILLRRPGDDVQLLSVTGLLLCAGRVLLGQRGGRLRSYPGMWEIGPAGGLDPAGDRSELGLSDVQAALQSEIREEIGLDLDVRAARLIGVCSDEAARSLDIVMRVDLGGPLPLLRHGEGWEYQDAGWVPVEQLPAFVRERQLIAPSLAIMMSLGWIGQPPPPGSLGSLGSSGCS